MMSITPTPQTPTQDRTAASINSRSPRTNPFPSSGREGVHDQRGTAGTDTIIHQTEHKLGFDRGGFLPPTRGKKIS
jgi:hypothetical protein